MELPTLLNQIPSVGHFFVSTLLLLHSCLRRSLRLVGYRSADFRARV